MQAELIRMKWQQCLELWRLQDEASNDTSEMVEVKVRDRDGDLMVGW